MSGLSVCEIARQAGIPASTVARYLTRFSSLILHDGQGRRRRYPPEVVQLVKRARDLYEEGLSKETIRGRLETEQGIAGRPDHAVQRLRPDARSVQDLTTTAAPIAALDDRVTGLENRVKDLADQIMVLARHVHDPSVSVDEIREALISIRPRQRKMGEPAWRNRSLMDRPATARWSVRQRLLRW
jgi:DNA-binding transcriptional MerR regulator